jgi:hypothetical protein
MLTTDQKYESIQSGYQLIHSSKGYTQSKVVRKIIQLEGKANTASFNKIINSKNVGEEVLTNIFDGLQLLIQKELCFELNKVGAWVVKSDCETEVVILDEDKTEQQGFAFYPEGRLHIEDKVKFFESTTTQMVEFGTTLNTFTTYLLNLRQATFKQPIQALLKKGVNIQCYLLDPDWNGTALYFNDRDIHSENGTPGIEKIRASLRRLKIITQELEQQQYPGTFEVFTYEHIPSNYFLAIDADDKSKAKMMVSHYLYGESRANCPVMEFTRQAEPTLFIRYQTALNKLIKSAKKVDFNKI